MDRNAEISGFCFRSDVADEIARKESNQGPSSEDDIEGLPWREVGSQQNHELQ